MDGGIHSGHDVLKAWAPGAMGEAGTLRALQIIHEELDMTIAFCGHTDIRNVGRQILLPG